LYGRRGAGKSRLLVRALEGRAGLYYQATTEVMRQQLADISAETRRVVGAPIGRFESVGDFLDALTGFARRAPDHRFPSSSTSSPIWPKRSPAWKR